MSTKGRFMLAIIASMIVLLAVSFAPEKSPKGNPAARLYEQQLRDLATHLTLFKTRLTTDNLAQLQQQFVHCRTDYKRIEFAVEYHFPFAGHKMNGPAVLESEPGDANDIVVPNGFQVLETYLYDSEEIQKEKIEKELDYMLFLTRQLQLQVHDSNFTAPELCYAVKLNLYRLASKGLSGFDSPIAQFSISEAAITLQSAVTYLKTISPLSPTLEKGFNDAIAPLEAPAATFSTFDRAQYLAGPFRKLLQLLQQEQRRKGIPDLKVSAAVKTGVPSFYDKDAFDPYFFAPEGTHSANGDMIKLGKMLFNEPMLTQNGRTCASCHKQELAYTDGLKTSSSLLHGDDLKRNTPTLIHAALQPALFYDGRTRYLEDQILQVLNNKEEMHSQLSIATTDLKKSKTYSPLFSKAFRKDTNPLTEQNIAIAIAGFVRTLTVMNSRFDQFMRGNGQALTKEEQQGFNLFMSKAQCGTCHYQPLFNGAVPPIFDIVESEVIGVPANTDTLHATIDEDPGAFIMFPREHKEHAFRTPTLRNIGRTAPYMHNGIYRTLEEVMNFYNRGGGKGLRIPIENQTLSEDRLNLTPTEQKAIIAFLKALDDV